MQWMTEMLATYWAQLKIVLLIVLVGAVAERFFPAQRKQPLGDMLFNIVYFAFFVMFTDLVSAAAFALLKPALLAHGALIPIRFPDSPAGQVCQALAFLFIYDFFYYWLHRAQHRFAWAWPIHKLHHSDRSVNITTTLRHHWLEGPLRILVILIPIGVLFDQKPITISWIATAMMLAGYFVHLNVRMPLGPLTPIFAAPQWHRLHHSIEARHADRNFAAFFPLLDIIFGTYTHPRPGEYPATGLHSNEDLNRMPAAVFSPFRDWLNLARGRR